MNGADVIDLSRAATPGRILILVQLAAVWYATGLVWTFTRLDYPLVARLAHSSEYMAAHNDRFWAPLLPGLAIAGVTAVIALVVRPWGVPLIPSLVTVALLVGIMVLSGAVATPLREQLAEAFSQDAFERLMVASWVRTGLFTAWGALDAWLIYTVVRPR